MGSSELFTVLDTAFDAVGLAAPEPWRWVYANRELVELLGCPTDNLVGQTLEETFDDDSQAAFMDAVNDVWNNSTSICSLQVRLARGGDSQSPIEVRLCRTLGDEPLVGVIMRRAPIQKHDTIDAARLDPLTNLPDRTFLLTRLGWLMRSERSADKSFAVLFLDLDDFKQVNDRHGHLVGDSVLREAARRLSQCVREGDHVVRFGGDEFIVLVEQVTGWIEIDTIIGRIRAALAKPIALPEGEVTLSLSVGVAMASAEHRSPEELVSAADRAMYAAKPART